AMGAPDPRDEPASTEEVAAATSWEAVLEKRKRWWSFQPIRQPELPAVNNRAWSTHPIDQFILAGLEENKLEPVAKADSQTLVRRLFFVLIGLPPTPEEAEHWQVELANPNGYEQLVDHLLARPEFGERWARHWMDWIRYAESHGSEGDPEIVNAWYFRDYLIRALNDDVPYDQLLREHVAGDLLQEPRINKELGINESLIGTAHWRMVFHGFAPTDALDEKVRFTDDQINAFSKAFLGLTVSCARCHDHKFDAISQADYYALFGILGSCRPGRVAIDVESQLNKNRDKLAELKPQLRAALAEDWLREADSLADQLFAADGPWNEAKDDSHLLQPLWLMHQDMDGGQDFATAWQARIDAWQAELDRRREEAQRVQQWSWDLGEAADYETWFPSGTGLSDKPSEAGAFAIAPAGENALAGIYPAGVYSHLLSSKHPARLTSANIQLDGEYELWVRALGSGGAALRYVVQNYPRSGTVYPVTELSSDWQWQKFDLSYWNGDSLHIEVTSGPDAPLLVKDNARSWFGIREAMLVPKGQTGPASETREALDPVFEMAAVTAPASFAELATCYAGALSSTIAAWRDGRASDAQAALLAKCIEQGVLSNELQTLATAQPLIEAYRRLEEAIPVPTRVPGLEETVGRDQPLFVRGNHKQPADNVPRRFLEAIDDTPYQTPLSGRRQLAEDLLRDDNPLTRRVIVNRLWHHLFGQGLVGTPDNFGSLGQTPTHPELLDWLATQFVENGWSLKQAIRQMVTSNTWQLASTPPEAAAELDPENHLLSHSNVRRLEAEAIRDALLQAAGELNPQMFGTPVDGTSARRSVYVQVKRNALDPFLRVFDFPEPFTATGRRNVTNVPAQSLTLMNDEQVAALATAWGQRVSRDDALQSDAERVETMFQQAFSRKPSTSEITTLTSYVEEMRQHYKRLVDRLAALEGQIDERREALAAILTPARSRLEAASTDDANALAHSVPQPIAYWEFDGDLADAIGDADGSARNGARLEDDALVVDGNQAHVVTAPLKQTLREKTLEAWVTLDQLDQQGGGVMTVQTPDGVTFDSIVFGEASPRQWLAGSNNFRRTQPFAGEEETQAVEAPVHLAIAYHADGRIVGYRNGQPYGSAYQSEGPAEFKAGNTVVSFGVRHLPATGNRMLSGRIHRAHLYDRALTDEEIAATSQLASHYVSETQVLESLSPENREQFERDQQAIETLTAEIGELGEVPEVAGGEAPWVDLARAMFSFKEFIYIK
ncbi:MAG: DUF1553 domain-containing protein, partial [Pirellulales bacterium]